jgi:hypothetical protein
MVSTKTVRKSWTVHEFRQMWKLKNAGKTNKEISKRIGRSPAAIARIVSESHDYMSL